MVTFPMMSRDPKRSMSCSRYTWTQLSRKSLAIEARFQKNTNRKIGNGMSRIEWSRDLNSMTAWRRFAISLVVKLFLTSDFYRKKTKKK